MITEFESTILENIHYHFSKLKSGSWFCKLLSDNPAFTDLIIYKDRNVWKSGQGPLPYIANLGECVDGRQNILP